MRGRLVLLILIVLRIQRLGGTLPHTAEQPLCRLEVEAPPVEVDAPLAICRLEVEAAPVAIVEVEGAPVAICRLEVEAVECDTFNQAVLPREHRFRDLFITNAARAPYLALENRHRDLFRSGNIQRLPENGEMYPGRVEDVDTDEMRVINASRTGSALGTNGLGPCIAITAHGRRADGQVLIGLIHSSGINDADTELGSLQDEMVRQGAGNVQFHLVGGMIAPEGDEPGSLPHERNLLALRNRYDIRGARLHVLEGELGENNESRSTDVVIDQRGVYYRSNPLYDPPR
jgi:hypothetical protein